MEREHEELLQIQLQLCTYAMPGTLSIDALKSLALLRYQMHTPVGAAHLASNYTRSISSKTSKYGALMIPIFHGHGIHVCESCFARDISKVFGAHPWPFQNCHQSGFPSIQSSTSPPHQSLGLCGMIMYFWYRSHLKSKASSTLVCNSPFAPLQRGQDSKGRLQHSGESQP